MPDLTGGSDVLDRARGELFTDESGLHWLVADGRSMRDALEEFWKITDPEITTLEVDLVTGRIEDLGDVEGLWFTLDEDGDVECWQVSIG